MSASAPILALQSPPSTQASDPPPRFPNDDHLGTGLVPLATLEVHDACFGGGMAQEDDLRNAGLPRLHGEVLHTRVKPGLSNACARAGARDVRLDSTKTLGKIWVRYVLSGQLYRASS